MPILQENMTREYLRSLSYPDIDTLCGEIREEIIRAVSQNGGHLAANLGTVELTVALFRTLDLPTDKLFWDVGHQTYAHKILSGRLTKMDKLRQFGGISGFPRRAESPYDLNNGGHSSTAAAIALGYASARAITHETYKVCCVVGDGAMTGGAVYECMNNIHAAHGGFLWILNDNEMSISPNVGSLAKTLDKIRTSRRYIHGKTKIKGFLSHSKKGRGVMHALTELRDRVKYFVRPHIHSFEEMGFACLGPVDGHNVKMLEKMITKGLEMDKPVILHVHTQKGRGYRPAEANPEKYHAIAPFDTQTGAVLARPKGTCFSAAAADELEHLAKTDQSVFVVCPSTPSGCGLVPFRKHYPDRFFDTGISEGHAVTFSVGLALAGQKPVVCIYASFLQRAYDMVLAEAALNNAHVVFCIDHCGLVDRDGENHQGLFDLSFLLPIPNLSVLAPANDTELRQMLRYAVDKHTGPIAIRFPKGGGASVQVPAFSYQKAQVLRRGHHVTLAIDGSMVAIAEDAANLASEKWGLSVEIVHVSTIKPFDRETLEASIKKTDCFVTLENHMTVGGMGAYLSSALCTKALCLGYPDTWVPQGSVDELNEYLGMTPPVIAEKIHDYFCEETGNGKH